MADNPKFTEHEAQYELMRRASEVLEQMVTESITSGKAGGLNL